MFCSIYQESISLGQAFYYGTLKEGLKKLIWKKLGKGKLK